MPGPPPEIARDGRKRRGPRIHLPWARRPEEIRRSVPPRYEARFAIRFLAAAKGFIERGSILPHSTRRRWLWV